MSMGRALNELKNSFQIEYMIRIRGINQYRSTFSKTYVLLCV